MDPQLQEFPRGSPGASTVRIGPLGIGLHSADPVLAGAIEERYAGFLDRAAADYEIELVRLPGRAGGPRPAEYYEFQTHYREGMLLLSSPILEGSIDFGTCRGTLAISPHPRFGAGAYLENALRQITQAAAVERGAFLLHAAAVAHPVRDEVEIFTGTTGSGKSTISAILSWAGGRVLSDDIVLVEVEGTRVISTPFFGTLREVAAPIQEPLSISGINFLQKGEEPSILPIESAPLSLALLLANVPFTTCFDRERRQLLMEWISRLMAAVPARRLQFRRDHSFLPLIGWEAPGAVPARARKFEEEFIYEHIPG